jgi:hypothetical protein
VPVAPELLGAPPVVPPPVPGLAGGLAPPLALLDGGLEAEPEAPDGAAAPPEGEVVVAVVLVRVDGVDFEALAVDLPGTVSPVAGPVPAEVEPPPPPPPPHPASVAANARQDAARAGVRRVPST